MAHTFGPRTHSIGFDSNLFQGNEPTCAVRSQEIIMRDFGIQIPQEELKQYAQEHGWYNSGTPINCMSNLLNTVHIDTHTIENARIEDLMRELNAGHRVIVAVDANELWRDRGVIGNWIADHFVDVNHALIVTSLNVDAKDPSKSTVLLTDPGTGRIIECPYSFYEHSWGDSGCFMIATNEAAPYQYNPDTGMMEYSDFATAFTISEFPFHNDFSDIHKMEGVDDYHPVFGVENLFSTEDCHAEWAVYDDQDFNPNPVLGAFSTNAYQSGFDDEHPMPSYDELRNAGFSNFEAKEILYGTHSLYSERELFNCLYSDNPYVSYQHMINEKVDEKLDRCERIIHNHEFY